MRAFVGLVVVVCCVSLSVASERPKEVHSEDGKQGKRSLSHGSVLGGGYPYSSYPSGAGHYGSYGIAGSAGIIAEGGESSILSSGPLAVSSGPGIISGGPGIISGGPGIINGGPGIIGSGAGIYGGSGFYNNGGFINGGGPGFAGASFATSGVAAVSTNTDTLTTVRQNVPVPVPVDRPVPV